MNRLTAYSNETVPVGNQVANRFPWWQSAYETINSANSSGENIPFGGYNKKRFLKNEFPYPLYIDEIRFWTTLVNSGSRTTWINSMGQTGFKIRTDQQGWIMNKFIPGNTLNTEMDRHLFGPQQGMVFTLPADYYLSHGNTFIMHFDYPITRWEDRDFQVAARGYDPTNHTPQIISASVETILDAAGSSKLTVALDDNRDKQVRDMWIRDFVFALKDDPDAALQPQHVWNYLSVNFEPPEGSHWTFDEWTPLIALADQVYTHNQGAELQLDVTMQDQPVIHRPVTPYLILPGQGMQIDARLLGSIWDMTGSEDVKLWAHVRGYVEGTHAG